jgi:hypothetical protein
MEKKKEIRRATAAFSFLPYQINTKNKQKIVLLFVRGQKLFLSRDASGNPRGQHMSVHLLSIAVAADAASYDVGCPVGGCLPAAGSDRGSGAANRLFRHHLEIVKRIPRRRLVCRLHVLPSAVADGDREAGELHEALRLALVRLLLDLDVGDLELLLGGEVREEADVVVAVGALQGGAVQQEQL